MMEFSELAILGVKIKYLTAGEGEKFAVVLQGWATKSDLYSGVISTLAAKYRVIFPLLPGFGESDEPESSFEVSDYARLVNELLAHLDVKRAVFFCHSYGGRVFYKLNARDDRATRPTSVILSDTAGIVPKKSLYKRLRIKIYKLGRRILSTKVMRFFFPDALEELRRKNGSADYNSATPVMRETLVRSVNEDLSDLIPLVNCPALVMWGVHDDAVPLSDAYKIRDAIKDSPVIEFSSSGHFPFITERARFLAVMRSFFSI
jgi:pimeloyl-ACP methyl ester carboxylesterase